MLSELHNPPNNGPIRMCGLCRKKISIKELYRLIYTREGTIELDLSKEKFGRGLYFCRSSKCLSQLTQHKKYKKMYAQKMSTVTLQWLESILVNSG